MKSFIIKNWVGMFLLLLVLSLSFLGWIAIEINDGLAKFLEKSEGDDKRMDVIGSIFGTSVAIASALVAIILARTALLFAENEEKREFRVKIEERIKTIQDVNNKIINSAKELRFIAHESLASIVDYLIRNNIRTVTPDIDNIFKEKINKNKEPLRKFADAIKQLDSNSLIFKHYKVMLEKDKKDEKDGYKPSDVIDIAVAMENKFIDNLNVIEIWNHISKHFGDLQNKSEEFLEEFSEKCSRGYKIDKHEFFKWVVCSLIMGFSLEKNNGKIQSLLFIDILLNLPDSESFKKISESLESEFYQNHQEYAKKTIDFLAGQIIEERIPELRCVKKFLEDNQKFLEIKIS